MFPSQYFWVNIHKVEDLDRLKSCSSPANHIISRALDRQLCGGGGIVPSSYAYEEPHGDISFVLSLSLCLSISLSAQSPGCSNRPSNGPNSSDLNKLYALSATTATELQGTLYKPQVLNILISCVGFVLNVLYFDLFIVNLLWQCKCLFLMPIKLFRGAIKQDPGIFPRD